MSEELERLRRDLAAVDRKMMELAAERRRLASAVGTAKRAAGLSTRDYRQEREVVERARRIASEIGLPEDLAEEMVLLLIRSALMAQERDSLVMGGGGSGKRALVVGGGGKMGRWFVGFLGSQGYRVDVADPAGGSKQEDGRSLVSSWREAEPGQDLIVLATPLEVTNEILLEMAESPPEGLVFDIGSLKSPLRSGLTAMVRSGARVTSIHPMFGPDTELLSSRHVIFVEIGNESATQAARELFDSTMAVQVSMDLESHDRLIAYVLGLSHALNIAFFTALAESGEAAPMLARLSSTTFDEQLSVARKVAGENPRLYFEIQSLNDYGTESLSALLYAVERLRSVVRAGDESGFESLMSKGREYLERRQMEGPDRE